MGRITIFTIEDCKFCRRTKAALTSRNIPYTEINIEIYPQKRTDMISLSDKLTVPQVFFNDEHIGGSEETLKTLSEWDEEDDETPYDRYVRLIGSQPEPTDRRLKIPEGSSICKEIDFTTSRTQEIFKFNDKEYTSLELSKMLIQNMPRESLTYWGVMYYNCFTGSSGVTALMKMFDLNSREDAMKVGLRLQRKHYLSHVCGDHPFKDSDGFYFRLQAYQTPAVLNSFRVWCAKVDEKPSVVINRLAKLWSQLESTHLSEDGKVDLAAIRNDDLYWKFEEDVCELQNVHIKHMKEDQKKAFVINLYNLLVKYAFCKVGIAETSTDRSSFFGDVSINVGGCIYSLDDLEHGILRANHRHPYQLSKRFGIMDTRKTVALKSLDPRIHFSLNCGAKSCPPVVKYSAESLDTDLNLSAMAFCEDENNVSIDEENNELQLSKLFFWYMSDFVKNKDELPVKVAEYLRGEKKVLLNKLIEQGDVTVSFKEYDWSSNNINAIAYKQGDLKDRSISIFSKPSSEKDK